MSKIFEAALVYATVSPPEITSAAPIKVAPAAHDRRHVGALASGAPQGDRGFWSARLLSVSV